MVIKAFIIAGNGCESEPLHYSEVDGITGQDTTGWHLLTHLMDSSQPHQDIGIHVDGVTLEVNKRRGHGLTCVYFPM